MRTAAFAVALLVASATVGCGPRAKPPVAGPTVAPTAEMSWKTLRAEHRVTIDVQLDDGKHDRRSLRGAIAVERPDRFRLRALGPGGITLFDVVSVGGHVKVLQAIRDPSASALGEVIQSMAGDLQASFLLEPVPPGRKVAVEGDALVVQDGERTVRLSAWQLVGGKPVATRIAIENRARHYAVDVGASEIEVDSALDPALFSD